MWTNKQGLIDLSVELVEKQSISVSNGEVEIAQLIYDKLKQLDYYKENPRHLNLVTLNDKLGRNSVCALMKSKKATKKTLLTVAHMDTVGIDDAGSLKDFICKPYEYIEKLKENIEILDKSSKEDILSGEWMFARGIMDMKTGLAIHMSLVEYFSELENFEGNIIFLAVPDEEVNSEGAISVIPYVNKLLESENLEAIAVLNCEPNFALYDGDDNKYLYLGSCGKVLPGFYVVGKEVHVGESLSGINTNLLSSEIISRLELNTSFCEKVGDEVTLPPTCLKYKDNKEEYNVQTPISSIIYYNVQTFKSTPKTIVEKLKLVCEEAALESKNKVYEARKKYEILTNGEYKLKDNNLDVKVLTFDELYNQVINDNKKENKIYLNNRISEWINDKSIDDRELSLNIVREVHKLSNEKNPVIVIFFSPPYYPSVGFNKPNESDQKLMAAVNNTMDFAKSNYGIDLKKQNYFQGLSDLSYFSLQNAEEVINILKPNMPAIGYNYKLPLEEIAKLNLPVVNLGPHGKDAHKFTERILIDYSYEILPELVRNLVIEIFKNQE